MKYSIRSEFNIAKELSDQGYYLDSIKILKKLQKEEPSSSVIKFELARAWIMSDISKERGEKYLHKLIDTNSPVEALAKIELGRIKLNEGKYEEARKLFTDVLEKSQRNTIYALAELIFLEIREENYEKAYDCLKERLNQGYSINDTWKKENSKQIKEYLQYKLGKTYNLEYWKNHYFYSQMLEYNEENAIEHIKLHLDENENKQYHSVYLDSINIRDLFEESKDKITKLNPRLITVIDKYVLECDRPIGLLNGEEVDCLKVVTFPNTLDIITMYPSYNPKTRVKK